MLFKHIFVYPKYPANLQRLYDLAYNLWCTWDYGAVGLFYRIDTSLFRKVDHNPLKFMHSLSKEKLDELSADKGFLFELDRVWEKFEHYLEYAGSFKAECSDECSFQPDDVIAYFSMEFGLHESICIYAGGLGVLSGDFLKSASDMDLPIIGIGLLYKFGYFTQHIDINGYQHEAFKRFEHHDIPIREIQDENGDGAYVNVKILNEDVKVKLWKIDVGKTSLILLDTDIEENRPALRDITGELYVGDRQKRLQQELVIGMGGIKALQLLGIKAKVYHFNEGHSAFAIIQRLQDLMALKGFSFSQAKAIIRASSVFTTHTPVQAGNENFKMDLLKIYLQPVLKNIKLSFEQLAQLGRVGNDHDTFWLPAFAMRFSSYVNGVSVQHANISRKMWAALFRERPIAEIPITSVTNGVHMSWISPPVTDLFNRYLGPDYIHCGKMEELWRNIYNIPDEELWHEHRRNKKDLFQFIRRQFAQRGTVTGYAQAKFLKWGRTLNTDYLTIVFARRFAAYKRPTLILKDRERFRKILSNPDKPVQIIFAGKAHPADEQSKNMIKEVIDFAAEYGLQDRVLFLENYDINIARHLHWGADVWLNNPAPGMEASGTSGMKAAMNGVLHLSTFEGWWIEGYNGSNGWAITQGNLYDRPDLQEIADANQLYDLLENEVTEIYYDRNEADISPKWVQMMKESIFSVCQNFNMNRVLCDYLSKFYVPSRENSARMAQNDYELLNQAITEEEDVLKYWENIEIVSFTIGTAKKEIFTEDQTIDIRCSVRFAQARPDLFNVELYYSYDKNTAHQTLIMEPDYIEEDITHYKIPLKMQSYGPQNLNVRIKPANQIVQDIHPELIKWKD